MDGLHYIALFGTVFSKSRLYFLSVFLTIVCPLYTNCITKLVLYCEILDQKNY